MLTPKDVARELNVCSATVLTWAKAGKIKSLMVPGGRTTYRFDQNYIASLKRNGNNHRLSDTVDSTPQEINSEGLQQHYGKKAGK